MLEWHSRKVKLGDLKDYNHNPRHISKQAMEKLCASLREDGYHQRLIVNCDLTIIGGHQRKKALLHAGFSPETEMEVLEPSRFLTPDEVDRINIRDNLSYGAFDTDLLANRFDPQTLSDFGMPDDLLKSLGIPSVLDMIEEQPLPTIPPEPKAKLGDIYTLGTHRLMCGDSTNPEHVAKLLNDNIPILMVTDPPYGVNYDPEWRERADKGVDIRSTGKVLNDDRADWTEAYKLFPGDVAYVWHPSTTTHLFAQNLEACGFTLINLIIWSKQHFVLSRGDYHNQHELLWYASRPQKKKKKTDKPHYTSTHEPLWYAHKKGKKHNWQGKRDQTTVWDIANNNSFGNPHTEEKFGHGTQKPLECMLRLILNNTAKGEGVYDPFCGSGTTLIACEKSGRVCTAMELSPAYVDMTLARWEKETSGKALLEGQTEHLNPLAGHHKA
jgi:DNA modification methylase